MNNQKTIEEFYQAFQNRDAEKMASLYHHDIIFRDPAFGELKGEHAGNMWRMLMSQADKNLTIRYSKVQADENRGSANWEADYLFSKTGRYVKNKIKAEFEFKDGLIYRHTDYFNIWKWSQMALGPIGYVLGFTPFVKNKIRRQALSGLKKFEESRN